MSAADDIRTRRYRRWRRAYLSKFPLCVRCCAAGRTAAATEVDHIVPRAAGGALMAASNVRGLCSGCHIARGRGEWSAADRRLSGAGGDPTAADLAAAGRPGRREGADQAARRKSDLARESVRAVTLERRRWTAFAGELLDQ